MTPAVEAGTRARPDSPYKGLAPFQDSELDELLFFGREREREVIVANLVAARLTILYGPSGVGKSSVLRAAVVRDVRGLPEKPLVVVHDTWSDDPVAALTGAVAAAAGIEPTTLAETVDLATAVHGEAYLVLDQLEEYFVYQGGDPALGDALAELTGRATLPVHVLLGIREDVLARLDLFKGRVPGLLANRLRLDHLTREGGRRAIVGPIERFAELVPEEDGPAVEPGLVEAVLDGVRTGALVQAGRGRGVAKDAEVQSHVEAPYLQVVMQRLWEEEQAAGSDELRLSTLERLGGPGRIVEGHLERALGALTPAQKELAARTFNHLVTPTGTKIAHRTSDLAGYAGASEPELEPVLSALGRERILRPVGGDHGDAHEIYHDVLADAVLAWRGRFAAEQAFEREREAARRRHRRLLVVASASLLALALTAAVAVFALTQRSEARAEAQRAHARELDAEALGNLTDDPAEGLEQALDAARLSPDPKAEEVLRETLLASRLRGVLAADEAVTSAVYSQGGGEVLTAGDDGVARTFDAQTHELRHAFRTGSKINEAVLDPAGRVVVTAGADGLARVFDVASGDLLASLQHGGAVNTVDFSLGGQLLLTASEDGSVRVWDTATWESDAVWPHPGPVRAAEFNKDGDLFVTRGTGRLAHVYSTRSGRPHPLDQGGTVSVAIFSGDGEHIITAGENETAHIWRARSGRHVKELTGHRGPILAAAQRGGLMATASSDLSIRVWSFPEGELITVLIGHKNPVRDVAFSSDGFSLVSTSDDGTARVWQAHTGEVRAVLVGHGNSVTSASFNREATEVVTTSRDGTARIWDPQIQPRLRLVVEATGPVRTVAFSRDGTEMVVAGPGRRVWVRNAGSGRPVPPKLTAPTTATAAAYGPHAESIAYAAGRDVTIVEWPSGELVRRLHAPSNVTSLSIATDGSIAAGSADGSARIWNPNGDLVHVLPTRGASNAEVSLSPEGTRLVVGTSDGFARVWALPAETLELELDLHMAGVTSAHFNHDGTEIVTASLDGDAKVWNAETGGEVRILRRHNGDVSDAQFSPDGNWVVTAGPMTAGLWDASSGSLVFLLRGHRDRLTSAAFDWSSSRIVTSSVDGSVRTYRCDICGTLDVLVPLAEKRLAAGMPQR